MLEFRINDIPLGKSVLELDVTPVDLEVDSNLFKTLRLLVDFSRDETSIDSKFRLTGELNLICDRSLEEFKSQISGEYEVLFKSGTSFESEDERMAVKALNVASNVVDIRNEVRDTLILCIPVRKLHPRFIDADGNETEFNHHSDAEDIQDPRWDALKALKQQIQKN